MRNLFILLFLSVQTLGFAQSEIPKAPSPFRLVNDYTGNTLSATEINALERKMRNYEDTTSTQVAILIVNNLSGYEVVDFAQRTAQAWGIGQSDNDNGIFILVAKDDRKAAIVTGYGMEGSITDAATFTIREEYMNPRFREGNFYKGLDDASSVIFKLASGEFTAEQVAEGRGGGGGIPFGLLFLLIFFIIPALVRRRRGRSMGTRGMPWWAWMMMGSTMGGSRHNSNWDSFRGGGGSFGGGGGGFGGGGFGGGSFGGGGSGGSW